MECYEGDDHFYAELREQILLLTAEEDNDVEVEVEELQQNKLKISAKSLPQRFNMSPASAQQVQNGCYYNWSGDEETESVPPWLFNLWKSGNGNGTGVFIPQITKSKTRYNPRGRNKARGRMYKPVAAYTEA